MKPVTPEPRPIMNKPALTAVKKDKEAVVIKKYANRRLYNTETSTYVTLDDLATMVRNDRDFIVFDAKTGDELTHSVLTQIIVEQENRQGGQTLLPIPFLRQLIRFYDDGIGRMVPMYLQFSLDTLAKEQEKFRALFAGAFGQPGTAFGVYSEQARKNLAMFEQALSVWAPFSASAGSAARDEAGLETSTDAQVKNEIGELRNQLAAMQEKIEKLARDRE